MKLEAVLLAAGAGSRMVELTRVKPKCLLPVGNQSLIWFAITGLRSIGVSRIIILIPDTFETEIKQYCYKKFNSFKDLVLDFVTISTKDDCGTAESILGIRDKIRGDFIVHSCDSIVDPKALSFLVNHYRLYDPIITMLLSDNNEYFLSRPVPGRRDKERFMRDVIAVEPLDKLDLIASDKFSANKLVFIQSERDLKKKIEIKDRELVLHPSLGVHSSFLDTHIYIFKRQMLDFMDQNRSKAVLKGEMIPLLISKQFVKLGQRICAEDEDEISDVKKHMDYEVELKETLENFNPRNVIEATHFRRAKLPRPSACHAIIVKDVLANRVNTLASFLDCNREAKTTLKAFDVKNLHTIKDCLIGENSTFGDKCSFKRGSIGVGCKVGDKVKMFDCVIMDNVEIESNTSLQSCIIGSNSKIGPKCDLKSCIVGYKQVVLGGRKANSEVIIDDDYVIDLSAPLTEDEAYLS